MKHIAEKNEPRGDCKYRASQNRHLFLIVDEDGKCLAWMEVPNTVPPEVREEMAISLMSGLCEGHELYPENKKMILTECACTENYDFFISSYHRAKVKPEVTEENRHTFFKPEIIDSAKKEIGKNNKTFSRKEVLTDIGVKKAMEAGGVIPNEINLLQQTFKKYRKNLLTDPRAERDRLKQERVDRMLRDISAF